MTQTALLALDADCAAAACSAAARSASSLSFSACFSLYCLRRSFLFRHDAGRSRLRAHARRVYLRQEVDGCCVDLGGVLLISLFTLN